MSKVVLFHGDSITDGNRYKDQSQAGDLNHQMGHSYAFIINGVLGSRYPEKYLHFVNRGVSGNCIADINASIQMDIASVKPDILSILVGANDAPFGWNDHVGTPPREYEKRYRMLLDEVKDAVPEIQFVLCEPFIIDVGQVKADDEKLHRYIAAYQEIVAGMAVAYQGIFVRLQQKFDEACTIREPEYWIWDGIHPTENGHGLIAREWMEATQRIL